MDFTHFNISQGSVATQLRCGGLFGNHFTTKCSQNAPVKKVRKSVNIWQRYGQNFVAYFFGPPCIFGLKYLHWTDSVFFEHYLVSYCFRVCTSEIFQVRKRRRRRHYCRLYLRNDVSLHQLQESLRAGAYS